MLRVAQAYLLALTKEGPQAGFSLLSRLGLIYESSPCGPWKRTCHSEEPCDEESAFSFSLLRGRQAPVCDLDTFVILMVARRSSVA